MFQRIQLGRALLQALIVATDVGDMLSLGSGQGIQALRQSQSVAFLDPDAFGEVRTESLFLGEKVIHLLLLGCGMRRLGVGQRLELLQQELKLFLSHVRSGRRWRWRG